jgi:hypothetical protein
MSDHFLVLIPEQPTYVPSPEARSRAVDVLRALVPGATKVEARLAEHVEFIDQGANFEKVLCPGCGEDLTDRWPSWMDEAAKSKLSELSLTTPCCGRATDLNALRYVWPAGFARFALRAENPAVGGFLALSDLSVLEGVVGCKLRQILAHY